jgi:hypothetical protein
VFLVRGLWWNLGVIARVTVIPRYGLGLGIGDGITVNPDIISGLTSKLPSILDNPEKFEIATGLTATRSVPLSADAQSEFAAWIAANGSTASDAKWAAEFSRIGTKYVGVGSELYGGQIAAGATAAYYRTYGKFAPITREVTVNLSSYSQNLGRFMKGQGGAALGGALGTTELFDSTGALSAAYSKYPKTYYAGMAAGMVFSGIEQIGAKGAAKLGLRETAEVAVGRTAAREATGIVIKAEFGNLSRAAEFGVQPYSSLTKALRGTGLEAHHLFEKRFATALGEKASRGLSIALTKAEHQAFTNEWRRLIPYGTSSAQNRATVMGAARRVYAEYPQIIKSLGF